MDSDTCSAQDSFHTPVVLSAFAIVTSERVAGCQLIGLLVLIFDRKCGIGVHHTFTVAYRCLVGLA